MRRAGVVACAVAALAAAAAGCGGPLSADEFRRQASAICAGDSRQIAHLPPPTTTASARAWVERVLAIVQDDVTRLGALQPPPQLRGAVHAALRAQEREIAELRALRRDLAEGAGPATPAGLGALVHLGRQSDEAFRNAGLPECASS